MKNNEFLDLESGLHVKTHNYIKDYFVKPRYFCLPKNSALKKIYIFFYYKFYRKIQLLISILIKSKIIFLNPKKQKNIIFDETLIYIFYYLFKKKDFFLLKSRTNQINEIYITKSIISFIIKNFFKNSLKINYLIALIKVLKPHNVITLVDNSLDFSILAKYFENSDIKFHAFQNAHRYENNRELLKKRFISNYYTFSKFENKIFKNKKNIKKFLPIGSLRAECAKKYFEKKKINKNIYDLCLVAEPDFFLNSIDLNVKNIDQNIALVAKYCLKFSKKFNKKIIITGKSSVHESEKKAELAFYKHHLKSESFTINFHDKKKFGSYKNIMQSKVIIGCTSSLIREAFAFNKKVLWCQFINGTKFPSNGICILKSKNYFDFEKRLKEILSISYKEYLNKIDNPKIIYEKKKNTFNLIKNELKRNT